jgi:hypothetical protein
VRLLLVCRKYYAGFPKIKTLFNKISKEKTSRMSKKTRTIYSKIFDRVSSCCKNVAFDIDPKSKNKINYQGGAHGKK